jgi:hypothetical protein
LDTFGAVSGLDINYAKSRFIPIAIHPDLIPTIQNIIQCHPLTLSTEYLSLPLSINRPNKEAFLPLISSVQKCTDNWSNRHLSYPGTTILANEVLNVMPTYYMQAFILPTWVVQSLQKITCRFLWRGSSANYSGDHCLVQWAKVTLHKSHGGGGLGVTDLKLQNITLTLKWLWIRLTNQTSLWSSTLNTLSTNLAQTITQPQTLNLSFYIQDILKLLPIFTSVTSSPPLVQSTGIWQLHPHS